MFLRLENTITPPIAFPPFFATMCTVPQMIHTVRTNIVIDDDLMKDTLQATGLKTKREASSWACALCCGCGNRSLSGSCAAKSIGRVTWKR